MSTSISAMIHVFEAKIQEKNLKLIKKYDQRIPSVVIGDPVRLHQIVLNLLSNAVKFTNEGEIEVSVELLAEDKDKVTIRFAVKDTGIGIAGEKLDHIFENFQQASSETARLYGGTGLGLAISKKLVESQGGTIAVTSNPKEGSAFSFILPFQRTETDALLEPDIVELDPEIKNLKVLVVEDVVINQLLMKTLLEDFGFIHDIVNNGKLAIERMKINSYDVILMDLHMPEMNGFEATRYIRNQMNSRVPIIALTADVTTVDLEKCKAAGMNDYISKPVDERILYSKIVELFKKSSLFQVVEKEATMERSLIQTVGRSKCVDLTSLYTRTKTSPDLMMEMISLYLEQTPSLISRIKQSLSEKDWDSIYSAAHKLIPSFSIMGMNKDFEAMAIRIQEYSRSRQHLDEIERLVIQLDTICSRACLELKEEYKLIERNKR